MIEDTDELAARIKRINEATEKVRGHARSVDGTVYIETDARGAITDLRLSPYALENGVDRLAALITDRHRVAYANAEAEAERVFTELTQEYPRIGGLPRNALPEDVRSKAPGPAAQQPPSHAPSNRHDGSAPRRGRFGDHEYVI